jgi:hypothetical protein
LVGALKVNFTVCGAPIYPPPGIVSFTPIAGDVRTEAKRPCAEAGGEILPWTCTFADYTAFGDVTVPRYGEVRWDLPEGPFTYWRGAITGVELIG